MPIDDRTTNRSYPLPNVANQLVDDVARLRETLQSIDADVFARYTKAEVDALIAGLIAGAPGALNTLDELAAALSDDANFAATMTTALSNRYTKAETDARYLQSIADGSIGTAKLADSAVTRAKVGESMIHLSSAQATQSGTYKDFLGIPSWARRVTLLLYGVSTNGASDILVQLGTGSTPLASGYINCQSVFSWGGGIISATSSAGIPLYNNSATYIWTGRVTMELLEPGLNNWIVNITANNTQTSPSSVVSSGLAPLTNSLGMVRLTTAAGTPAFDGGFASISWE